MRLPIQLICRTNRVHSDGTCTVFIQYCYTAESKILLHTGIKIPPAYWNKKQRRITDKLPGAFGNHEELNIELKRQYRIVEDLVTHAIRSNVATKGAFVKKTFSPSLQTTTVQQQVKAAEDRETKEQRDKLDIYYQLDDYIESKKRKVSKATLTVYQNVKSHLRAFETYRKKKITFESLDFSFYEDFVDYLTFEHVHLRRREIITGVKLNTIGKTIKHLRGFVKDRAKRKIIAPIDLTDFKIPEEESDAIYLTYDEIAQIYQTDLSRYPHLTEYRDLFVLACLTGLRFSDFSTLRPEDVQQDMLYKKQEKSDHWVIIPLRHEAKLIFTRQFRDRIPELTNPEFNKHIKTVGELAGISKPIKFSYKKGSQNVVTIKPKFDWITSHTARRSFCTNEFLAGTPVELIMKISGHKRTKDFYKYIRVTPEEAAVRIKELWLSRNDMRLIKDATEQIVQ